MIDTVVLSIPVTNTDMKTLEQFTPSAENIFTSDRGFKHYKRNPTAIEKRLKKYIPILNLYRRIRRNETQPEFDLQIQFSAPKLIYGNNFQEVSEYDFEEIVSELHIKLYLMGIHIDKDRIMNARVSAIDYSKNILLSKGLNSSMVLNQLYKSIDTNNLYDFTQVIFKNGGQTLHIHSNKFEFVMYDKVRELMQSKVSEKRSVDKQPYIQFSLLDEIALVDNYFRLELRLNTTKVIKEKIKDFATDYVEVIPTFKSLFNRNLSQQILSNYWNKQIRQRYIQTSWKEENYYDKVIGMKALNPNLSENQLMFISSVNEMIGRVGIQSVRSIFGWIGKNGYKWSRIKELLNKLEFPTDKLYIIKDIDSQLKEFSLFRALPNNLHSYM